ncbi:acyltransferase domain-containing protein [Burkholderiaceae bacterium UC74_6]
MSFALLFSGQGTQHPDMLPWLVDDSLVRATCVRLGVEDWRSALADPEWAQRNSNAQTLLTGLSLAAWLQVAGHVARPTAIAGYSVGELAAFSAAGVISAQAAAGLATQRAEAMDRSAAAVPGGLLAISGLEEERLKQLCVEFGLALAIRNGIESVIVGGPREALDVAAVSATRSGGQCTRLRINVASHTPWMTEAAASFAGALSSVDFQAPQTLLFSNVADRIRDAASARFALATQVNHTVRWDECMENIAARQVSCVLEVGPGHALSRLWNTRFPAIPARSSDDFRSVTAVSSWLNRSAD